jgi:hypothetical protein
MVKKMAPCGAISMSSSVDVMTLLDNHHLVGAMMAPASVQAEVPMLTELGARTHVMMMETALDHDGLSACNRRRRDSNRAKGGDNVSKPLRVRSSIECGVNMGCRGTFPRNSGTILNTYSA